MSIRNRISEPTSYDVSAQNQCYQQASVKEGLDGFRDPYVQLTTMLEQQRTQGTEVVDVYVHYCLVILVLTSRF